MGKIMPALYVKRRREQLNLCNGLAKKPLHFDTKGFVEDPEARRNFGRSVYTDLGAFAYEQFISSLDPAARSKLENIGTEDGFRVMGLLLGASPAPYLQFCKKKDRTVTVAGLQATLLRSSETPTLFMSLHGTVNHDMEWDFGLNRHSGEANAGEFDFEDAAEGEVFTVNRELFEERRDLITPNAHPDPAAWKALPEQLRQCPGLGFVVQRGWLAMIHLAGDVPSAFAHDLGVEGPNPLAA